MNKPLAFVNSARTSEELERRHRQVSRVLKFTLCANVLVIVVKLIVGLMAHSLAVVADAAHSSVDASNNILALVMARVAAKGPDEDHPYGHSKFETLGALGGVAFFSITIYQLVSTAIGHLIHGSGNASATLAAIATMVGSAIVSLVVSRYELARGRELRSVLLIADAAHTRSDLYASIAVLVGLALVASGFSWADPVFTLVVAMMIARTGYSILKSIVPILVDERAVDVETVCRIALATPGVVDCYDVRSRGREGAVFAELTIAVSRSLDVEQAHSIADMVEQRIAEQLGAREVVVHVEPEAYQRTV